MKYFCPNCGKIFENPVPIPQNDGLRTWNEKQCPICNSNHLEEVNGDETLFVIKRNTEFYKSKFELKNRKDLMEEIEYCLENGYEFSVREVS